MPNNSTPCLCAQQNYLRFSTGTEKQSSLVFKSSPSHYPLCSFIFNSFTPSGVLFQCNFSGLWLWARVVRAHKCGPLTTSRITSRRFQGGGCIMYDQSCIFSLRWRLGWVWRRIISLYVRLECLTSIFLTIRSQWSCLSTYNMTSTKKGSYFSLKGFPSFLPPTLERKKEEKKSL